MYSDSSDSECFSYDAPYQPKELPAEYLSGIEKLTCRMFDNDSPFYSALFSDQGEVAEVNEEISYLEDEENTSNVGLPIDLEPIVDIPYVADEENTIDLEPTVDKLRFKLTIEEDRGIHKVRERIFEKI